jgi:hypothetical protein
MRHGFEWISFGDAHAHLRGTAKRSVRLPEAGLALIERAAAEPAGGAFSALPRGREREVWICWRPLSHSIEARLASWALAAGAAIVVEPSDRLPEALVEWARPTRVSAPAGELARLLERLDEEAPALLRRRWLRQRLGRMRSLLVEEDGEAPAAGDLEALREAANRLVPGTGERIVRFAGSPLLPLV